MENHGSYHDGGDSLTKGASIYLAMSFVMHSVKTQVILSPLLASKGLRLSRKRSNIGLVSWLFLESCNTPSANGDTPICHVCHRSLSTTRHVITQHSVASLHCSSYPTSFVKLHHDSAAAYLPRYAHRQGGFP